MRCSRSRATCGRPPRSTAPTPSGRCGRSSCRCCSSRSAPLLIASFAFNFNNFTLIYLLTGGGPFDAGNTSIGSSDLLITYAYRLAFSGTTPNYGFAAAVSIFIFVIVAVLSYSGFRRTKSLEEVN